MSKQKTINQIKQEAVILCQSQIKIIYTEARERVIDCVATNASIFSV